MLCMIQTLTCITHITLVWEWQELLLMCLWLSWHMEADRCYVPSILMRGILRRKPGIRGLRWRAGELKRFCDSVVTGEHATLCTNM